MKTFINEKINKIITQFPNNDKFDGNIQLDNKLIINPTEELLLLAGFTEVKQERTLDSYISSKIFLIIEYDKSSNVNEFFINDDSVWLDRETRMSIRNSTEYEKELGRSTTTFWIGIKVLKLNCDSVLKMLRTLEIYAKDCYNKTQEHIKTVSELKSIQDVENYDFTLGYPEKLKFNIK